MKPKAQQIRSFRLETVFLCHDIFTALKGSTNISKPKVVEPILYKVKSLSWVTFICLRSFVLQNYKPSIIDEFLYY